MSALVPWAKIDPYREPDWRWRRVVSLCSGPYPQRCRVSDDEYVRLARLYAICRSHGRVPASVYDQIYNPPDLPHAWHFYELGHRDGRHSLFTLEARILARQSPEVISEHIGLSPGAISWYESLWFDVRSSLNRRDWVRDVVLIPAILRQYGMASWTGAAWTYSPVFFDATLKMFAYAGGEHVVDLLLDGGLNMNDCPTDPAQVRDWVDSCWANCARQRSARAMMMMHINPLTVTALFQTHLQLVALAKDTDKGLGMGAEGAMADALGKVMQSLPITCGIIGEAVSHKANDVVVDSPFEPRTDELMAMGAGKKVQLPTKLPRG